MADEHHEMDPKNNLEDQQREGEVSPLSPGLSHKSSPPQSKKMPCSPASSDDMVFSTSKTDERRKSSYTVEGNRDSDHNNNDRADVKDDVTDNGATSGANETSQQTQSSNLSMNTSWMGASSRDIEVGREATVASPSVHEEEVPGMNTPIEAYLHEEIAHQRQQQSIREAKVILNEDHERKRQLMMKGALYGGIFIAAALLIVLPLVFIKDNQENDNEESIAASGKSLDPVLVMQPIIGNISDLAEDSSEWKAFRWLAFDDPSGMVNSSSMSEWRLVQRFALIHFYFSTYGDSWESDLKFLTAAHECKWTKNIPYIDRAPLFYDGVNQTSINAGVTFCENDQVTGLLLPQNGLQGSLPSTLVHLSHLQQLDVSNNLLTGSLPAFLAKLTLLRSLNLSWNPNFAYGTIPSEWQSLKKMRDLRLEFSRLQGTIPGSVLAGMTDLRFLWLGNSLIRGELPTEIAQ
mmetsp:Transcript_62898/g.180961  ORF Transcript_62898/g.180961 Transcript_62898/m.180961 type:complete len:462 (+) Transcript_62898:84-1469(+)